jgi:hypothetical protein
MLKSSGHTYHSCLAMSSHSTHQQFTPNQPTCLLQFCVLGLGCVRQVSTIETQFRTFPLEVLAGDPCLDVEHKESGATFNFNFAEVRNTDPLRPSLLSMHARRCETRALHVCVTPPPCRTASLCVHAGVLEQPAAGGARPGHQRYPAWCRRM